ncbi:MAG: T9SS type A sorting domain-containing protein [Bacteroidia bacterium]|nr:T9SS type A sorting domain-containing protein [Bacteroidia bacterium]
MYKRQCRSFLLYPNPANKYILLHNTGSIKSIIISDITGKQMNELNPDTDSMIIDINSLPAGIYFLSILSHTDEIHTVRFIKNDKY